MGDLIERKRGGESRNALFDRVEVALGRPF
jgi:hypothetical protein